MKPSIRIKEILETAPKTGKNFGDALVIENLYRQIDAIVQYLDEEHKKNKEE